MAGESRIGAGFRYIYYGVLNASGILIGNTTTGATQGAAVGHSLIRLEGAQTIPIGLPEDEIVTVLGDDAPMVSFNFPGAELPSGVLELARRDQTFEALIQGTKEQTIGDVVVGNLMPSGNVKPDLCLLLMNEAKKWEGATKGPQAWEIVFVPVCQITPLYKDMTQRQHTPYRYGINVSRSARMPWAATFTEGLHGTTEAGLITVESDNPVMVDTWLGDSSRTAFTLGYAPKTTAKVYAYKNNGVNDPGASTAGLTLTYGSAPTISLYAHALYEVGAADL